jgi:hypothetical protein
VLQVLQRQLLWLQSSAPKLIALKPANQLRVLELQNCMELCSPSPLTALAMLEQLDISSCCRLTALSGLTRLTNLKTVTVSSCEKLTEMRLSKLPVLQVVHMKLCANLALVQAQSLPQLTKLVVNECADSAVSITLQHLTALKVLDMWQCGSLQRIATEDYFSSVLQVRGS